MNAMAPNLKEKTARIAGLVLGARLSGVGDTDLEVVAGWLDGLSAARLDGRSVEPRLSAAGPGLELLGWHDGLPRAMADWIGAGLLEDEREPFFELATRFGADPRRVARWAGTFAPEGRGYALAGALDLELAEFVVGAEGIDALVPLAEAARTEDLDELWRNGSTTRVAFPVAASEALAAWRSLGGFGASGPLETLLARSAGRAALTGTLDRTGLVSRGLRVRIADPVALAAGLAAAAVDEALDSRLAAVTAAFERELPSWVELRLTPSGSALWCGFGTNPR